MIFYQPGAPATVRGDGALELRVVALVLFGVRECEIAKGSGKLRAAAQVRTDRHGVPRAGVRPRQRPPQAAANSTRQGASNLISTMPIQANG